METASVPLFFTSYATTAEDRGQVQRFHTDVQRAVYDRLGRHPRHGGVLKDPFPRPGPEPAVLACRVLLALYSGAYMRSEDTARDWSVFHERTDRVKRRTGQAPQALIGVVWRAGDLVLPRSLVRAGALLHGRDVDGRTAGVADLLAGPDGLAAYAALVRQVAESLVAGLTRHVPAMSGADAAAVPPRFGPGQRDASPTSPSSPASPSVPVASAALPGRAAAAPAAPGSPPAAGRREPQQVTLLCLAAGRHRMAGLRGALGGYGETAEDWRPFAPQSDESASGLVARALLAYGVREVTVRPVSAGIRGGPVPPPPASPPPAVLLIDPWLAEALPPEALRAELADWSAAIGAVVVVLAHGDEETAARTAALRRAVLTRLTDLGLQAPHHEAGSPQGLAHAAIGAVADMLAALPGAPAEPLAPPVRRASAARRPAPVFETGAERLNRRRRERSSWLSPATGLLPTLLLGTSRETQAET